jgi:hypothetical protein
MIKRRLKGSKMKPQNSLVQLAFLFTAWGMMAHTACAFITIDTVPVGKAANANDPTTGFGAVDYNYRIGTYEVTLIHGRTLSGRLGVNQPLHAGFRSIPTAKCRRVSLWQNGFLE